MLIRFHVENFLSFKDEVVLSMVSGKVKKHPEQVVHLSEKMNIGLLRSALVYGANASGKSNLVKAISFARFMVLKGVRAKEFIPRKQFKLDPECNRLPSRFEFELLYKEKVYAYGFSLDNKMIHEEWLLEIRSASEKVLFKRKTLQENQTTVEFGLKVSAKEKNFLDLIAMGTPQNRLFLQESVERNIKFFEDAYAWFEDVLMIVYPDSKHSLVSIVNEDEHKFGELMVKFLNKFDTGICGYDLQQIDQPSIELPERFLSTIESKLEDGGVSSLIISGGRRYFVKKTGGDLDVYKLLLRHKNESCQSDVLFEMDEESDGTLRLMDLIPVLYAAEYEQEKVIVIDELDRSIHPSLSYEFLAEFLQSNSNKQIVVTTHEENLLDLDLLRRDEVWFVDKDRNGSSHLYSLEEFAPRYDKDIRKGYLLGRFGAVPLIH